jgi:hypothetical protein
MNEKEGKKCEQKREKEFCIKKNAICVWECVTKSRTGAETRIVFVFFSYACRLLTTVYRFKWAHHKHKYLEKWRMNQGSILISYEPLKNNLERAMFSLFFKKKTTKTFHQNNNLRSLRRQSNKVEIVTKRNSKF